jgi:hypothetical protein
MWRDILEERIVVARWWSRDLGLAHEPGSFVRIGIGLSCDQGKVRSSHNHGADGCRCANHQAPGQLPTTAAGLRPSRLSNRGDGLGQIRQIAAKALVRDIVLLVEHELAEVLGQLLGPRQRRHLTLAADASRDYNDPSPQCLGDLFAYVVVLAARGPCTQQVHPARADDGDQHIAGVERLRQLLIEALAGQQVVDVHEHAIAAEPGGEAVADAARISCNVIAAIADENPGRHELNNPSKYPRGNSTVE